MNDEAAPSDGDEAVGGDVSPYDVSTWLGEDEHILGIVGVVKYINADGRMCRYYFREDIDLAEAIGLMDIHKATLLDEVELEAYADWEDGEL